MARRLSPNVARDPDRGVRVNGLLELGHLSLRSADPTIARFSTQSPQISSINILVVLTTIKGISQPCFSTPVVEAYGSNFTQFYSTKSERERNLRREYDAQMDYRKHLQAFIDRWRYNANRAAQAQSKIKILEKVRGSTCSCPHISIEQRSFRSCPHLAEETENFRCVSFLTCMGYIQLNAHHYKSFPETEKISPPLLQLSEVTFGYDPAKIILNRANFDVGLDSRLAIVGSNGAGKSTLCVLVRSIQITLSEGQD
jgi:ATPase subunit of ABC transporter with duplicated ATPase domains